MARRKQSQGPVADANVEDASIGDFVNAAMQTYGIAVNEERSIPAFEDGMKPVLRRIMWAASRVCSGGSKVKSARLVGEVIGRLHAHGDAAVYGAVITAVNSSAPPIAGIGNWGTLIDPAAAQRYTNVTVSKYGQQFLHPAYLAVTPMTPNFDDTWHEPIVLPALLPNILINDTEGIGVGVRTGLPCFDPTSVLAVLIDVLDGKRPSRTELARQLKLYEPWGGRPVRTKDNFEQLVALMSEPAASITYESPLEIDRDAKRITLRQFAPNLNLEKVNTALRLLPLVKSVYSGAGLSLVVQCNPSANFNEFDALVLKVAKLTRTQQRYSIYVSERVPGEDGKYTVQFHRLGVAALLSKWLTWRVDLEVRSLKWRAAKAKEKIDHLELLLHAARPEHLKIIFQALQQDDTAKRIASGLSITLEQAEVILNLKVRSLSKLDTDALRAERDSTSALLKRLEKQSANPKPVVREYFEAARDAFKAAPRDPKTDNHLQWWMS